jgi:hypothetical protein
VAELGSPLSPGATADHPPIPGETGWPQLFPRLKTLVVARGWCVLAQLVRGAPGGAAEEPARSTWDRTGNLRWLLSASRQPPLVFLAGAENLLHRCHICVSIPSREAKRILDASTMNGAATIVLAEGIGQRQGRIEAGAGERGPTKTKAPVIQGNVVDLMDALRRSLKADKSGSEKPSQTGKRASYREQAELLAGAGADLLALEMIRDIDQACTIVEAAGTTRLPIMVGFTCRLGDDGQTVLLRGRDAERPLLECLDPVLAAGRCITVAVMHCDIRTTDRALDVVLARWRGPVACYPECGQWKTRIGPLVT